MTALSVCLFVFHENRCVVNQAVIPLLEGLEVDSNTYRLGLSQVIGHAVTD